MTLADLHPVAQCFAIVGVTIVVALFVVLSIGR